MGGTWADGQAVTQTGNNKENKGEREKRKCCKVWRNLPGKDHNVSFFLFQVPSHTIKLVFFQSQRMRWGKLMNMYEIQLKQSKNK